MTYFPTLQRLFQFLFLLGYVMNFIRSFQTNSWNVRRIGYTQSRPFITSFELFSDAANNNNGINSGFLSPLKTMIFVDGTWLFYSLILGRENCPVKTKYGPKWHQTHKVNWLKLPQILTRDLNRQLESQLGYSRLVETVRTVVFTSTRPDTPEEGIRAKMLAGFQASNFELHRLVTNGPQEKCVDISLAVEMLYMATVPDAYDIAIIITGDKDFIPAMQKTRMKAKRVAICSMRNSCNRDLVKPEYHIRDFDIIWLDDFIDELIVPAYPVGKGEDGAKDAALVEKIRNLIISSGGEVTSRETGRVLQATVCNSKTLNALLDLKSRHPSLRSFLEKQYDHFEVIYSDETYPDFIITLASPVETESNHPTTLPPPIIPVLQHDNTFADLEPLNDSEGVVDDTEQVKTAAAEVTNDVTSLSQLSISELKLKLRQYNLMVSGNKPELISRIENYLKSSGEKPSSLVPESAVPEAAVPDSVVPVVNRVSTSLPKTLDDISQIIVDHIKLNAAAGLKVNARDLGRFLKSVKHVRGSDCLAFLKAEVGSLRDFTEGNSLFEVSVEVASDGSRCIYFTLPNNNVDLPQTSNPIIR